MKFENALISRKMHVVESGEVCIMEVWDLKHPDCPFVPSKPTTEIYAYRDMLVPRKQYDQLKPTLKD